MSKQHNFIKSRTKASVKILSAVTVLAMLCSCGRESSKATKVYILPDDMEIIQSGQVAENSNYIMNWDDSYKSVTITEKSSGCRWSTIPYDTETESVDGYAKVNIHSPITISYIEDQSNDMKSMGAYQGAINKSTVSCKTIENGVRVTFYYDALGITVPVEYFLEDDGFSARIPIEDIEENGNKVYSISLLPFFAAVKNNPNSYLFVPSGSGALIYTDSQTKQAGTYSESVYGDDAVTSVTSCISDNYGAKLPVYGVRDALNQKGIFAVITSGAESAKIEAQAASIDIGYSSVYATLLLRGSDYVTVTDISGIGENVANYSENVVDIDYFTVKYFLISEASKSDYNGMAEIYRFYLSNNNMLKSSEQTSDYYLNILGGMRVKNMFLGIPYHTTYSATSLEQALEITKEAIAESGNIPIIKLQGYGDYGVDVGKIAGGYKISSKFGSKKDLNSLLNFAKENSVELFIDFDVLRYSRSSSGCSNSDAASTVNLTGGTSGYCDVSSNIIRKDYSEFGFIKRSALSSIVNKLVEKASKLSIDGISLSTLSSVAYSDYSDGEYTVKSHMARDVSEIIDNVNNSGYKTAVAMANAYAAGKADCILGTPEKSSSYDIIDVEIPFYQMVFKGSVPLYSSEINISANSRRSFLQALKTGQGLGFSVCSEYEVDMMTLAHSAFAGSQWQDIKTNVISMIKEASPFLCSVRNEQVVSYNILTSTLTSTKFSNGCVIYVNLGQTPVNTPLGLVESMGFIYGKE